MYRVFTLYIVLWKTRVVAPQKMGRIEELLYKAKTLRLKPPKLIQGVVFFISLLSFVRVVVLVAESYSVVSAERTNNADLIALCRKGAASESPHMRNACLHARSEAASPLLFKAILRACRTAFQDFVSAFNTPSRIFLLCLFCLSGLSVPIVRALSKLITFYITPGMHSIHAHLHEDEEQTPVSSVVVLNGRESVYDKLRMLPSRRRLRSSTITLSPDEGDDEDEDRGRIGNGREWRTVHMGA